MLDSLGRQVGLLDIGNLRKPPFILRRIAIVTKGRESLPVAGDHEAVNDSAWVIVAGSLWGRN